MEKTDLTRKSGETISREALQSQEGDLFSGIFFWKDYCYDGIAFSNSIFKFGLSVQGKINPLDALNNSCLFQVHFSKGIKIMRLKLTLQGKT